MMSNPRTAFFILLLAVIGRCVLAAGDPSAVSTENHTEDGEEVKVEVHQLHMGMMVTLTLYAPSIEVGRLACRAAFKRIAALDQGILSDYRPQSELRRLGVEPGPGPVRLSSELFTVLAAACRLAEQTDGRFDPTAGPVVRLWRRARAQQALPDPEDLRIALAEGNFRRLRLDAGARTLAWAGPAPALDLGAIAKGFIGDQVLAYCRELGTPRAMIEAGGDMVLGDPPPHTDGWPVELPTRPGEVARLANCAVSVSGDTSQFLVVDGVRYSHVIDARTGEALTHRRFCVVIAPSGLQADALATAGTLLEPAAFQRLLREHYPHTRGWTSSADEIQNTPAN